MTRRARAHVYRADDGHRFTIRSGNGRIVGPTEAFHSESNARRGFRALWEAMKQIHGVTQVDVEYCVEHHGIREADATWCDFRHHREHRCSTCDGEGELFVADGEPDVECPDCDGGTSRCDLRPLFYEAGGGRG